MRTTSESIKIKSKIDSKLAGNNYEVKMKLTSFMTVKPYKTKSSRRMKIHV